MKLCSVDEQKKKKIDVQRVEASRPVKTGKRTQKQGKITQLPEGVWFTSTC